MARARPILITGDPTPETAPVTWKALISVLAALVTASGALLTWAFANHHHNEVDNRIEDVRKEAKADLDKHTDAVDQKFQAVYKRQDQHEQRQYDLQSELRQVNEKSDRILLELLPRYPKDLNRAESLPLLTPIVKQPADPHVDGGVGH